MPRSRPEIGDQRAKLLAVLNAQHDYTSAQTLARLSGSTHVRTLQQLNRLEKDGAVERNARGWWKLKT